MQTAKQVASQDLWSVPFSQVHRTIQFIEPRVTANDFGALQPASGQDGLMRAIQRVASWLMAETIFGLTTYGAAAHPCFFDPARGAEPGASDRRD